MHSCVDLAGEHGGVDFLGEKPLSPASASARSWIMSPVVLMTTISNSSSAPECAAVSMRTTSRVCARANGDPRVPIFIEL
jgi:hypothetical protein